LAVAVPDYFLAPDFPEPVLFGLVELAPVFEEPAVVELALSVERRVELKVDLQAETGAAVQVDPD
jgi:hypothetical protein